MRLLLFDTTAYQPSSPLFLEAVEELTRCSPDEFNYALCDEARFIQTYDSSIWRVAARVVRRPSIDYAGLNRDFLAKACAFRPDLMLICKGAFLAPETLAEAKRKTGASLVNYATDDPFNRQVNTSDLLAAIPLYDIYACTKRAIMRDVAKAGCAKVIYVPFGYKPSVHFPEPPVTAEEHRRFDSDVVFIGGCDRDRVPFLKTLMRAVPGLNLALYGGLWNRHRTLRRYWRKFALGRDFRMALGGAKIALNLVRRANRDGHVMRSFEVPACGAFMLAERTDEHLKFLTEGREMACFGSPDELADQVRYYLDRSEDRIAIANAARRRVAAEGHSYRARLLQILAAAGLGCEYHTAMSTG